MKKLLALMLALVLAISIFTACGDETTTTTTASSDIETTTANAPAETTTAEEIPAETTTAAPVETTTEAPAETTTAATEKPTAATLNWSAKTGVDDATGATYTYGGEATPSGRRMTMTDYILVKPGDSITLDSDQFVFILYGYSDDKGSYIKNSYIDVDPADPNTNWGTSYTFTEGTTFGNGNTMEFPMYIRLLIKDKDPINPADIPESIKDSFTFNIESLAD